MGLIESMNLISGHPLLVNAAKEAVNQWAYKPLLVENEPTRFMTEVTVVFHLDAP